MIGKLTGALDAIGEDWLLIDVMGVGYRVHCAGRLLARLPGAGERLSLMIETQIREEEIRLFGFESEAERLWFRSLQSVQGVGAKLALAILGVLGPEELARAVLMQDKAALGRAPGVGPKLAQRIASELKDRVPAAMAAPRPDVGGASAAERAGAAAHQDALSALINLGYAPGDAARALAEVGEAGAPGDVAGLIRAGLRELAR